MCIGWPFHSSNKKAWEETKFSEDYLKDFHGYDIDFSLKNFLLGKIFVVYNILLEHYSLGTFSKTWVDTQLLVTERWKKHLPVAVESVSKTNIRNAEVTNLKEFLQFLIQHKYKRWLQLKYLINLLMIYPRVYQYHFLVRKVLLGNETDNKLKFLFKKILPVNIR